MKLATMIWAAVLTKLPDSINDDNEIIQIIQSVLDNHKLYILLHKGIKTMKTMDWCNTVHSSSIRDEIFNNMYDLQLIEGE